MSFENKGSFISSFLISLAFITYSCLIALPGTSSMMLKSSSERRLPCLVPGVNDFKVFTIKYNISCRFLVNILYQVEKVSISS